MTGEFQTLQKSVTTSGTPVQISATNSIDRASTDGISGAVIIKAKVANTGNVFIGNSSADALKTSGQNYILTPGQTVELNAANLNQIWIDSAVNSEGVEVLIK